MMRARLIWVGRENRRDPEAALCQRYRERIKPFARFEEKILKPFSSGTPEEVRAREGARIASTFEDRDYTVILDERGMSLDSPGLAALLDARAGEGQRPSFVIGGAMGLAATLRQRADYVLSLSPMTLPHALARVVLMEQLYRALTIRVGHPYHHEG